MNTVLVLRFCLLAATAATAAACTGAGYQAAERSLQAVAEPPAAAAPVALAPTKQTPAPEPVIAAAPPAPAAAAAPSPQPTSAPSAPAKSPPAAAASAPPKPAGDAAPPHMHYECPMDPQIKQATPGRCPICEMRLVLTKDAPVEGSGVDAKP